MSQDFQTLLQERSLHKCFCRIGRIEKGWSGTLHWHEHYEICRVIEGQMRFLIDGVSYDTKAGDIVCIDTAIPHASFNTAENTVFRLFKSSPSNFLQTAQSVKPLQTYISREQIASVDGLEDELCSLFDMLTRRDDVTVSQTRPFEQSLCAGVYFLLMEHFADCGDSHKSKSRERKIFFKTLDYVNAHFNEPINVNVLAEKLFYSRGRLSAIFTKYSGRRLGDYINTLRVQNVNKLISEGESITSAALSSGFQNIRSFNNVYRDVMGVSPSEYVKGNI